MTITFIGHGYVGLVTACIFANFGNTVWVLGHTKEKLDRLRSGDPIIYEPGLKELLEQNVAAGRLLFTDSYEEAIPSSEIVFITVGTPPKANGEADLSTVFSVAENVGKNLKNGFTVVSCKSTVPVGTNKKVEALIQEVKPAHAEFAVASCPEFLREGTGISDTLHPDRIVIGSESDKAKELLIALHEPLDGQRVLTDLPSAELIKYTSNAMLATKISFANLIAFYCEKAGADVENVLDAVGLDKRIGRIFLSPGVGYGGSCFPKDVKALIEVGRHLGIDTSLLDGVETVNKQARENMIHKIEKHVKGKTIGIWGLSFKPDTDDIRQAPSLYLIQELLSKGYTIRVFDPAAMENVKKQIGDKIIYTMDAYEAVDGVDALCILTEWNEFKQINLEKVKTAMRKPLILDGRNIYAPLTMKQMGFTYISTGRASV
ncbi:UDP-glucose/GDP-mannose dehydrogenase family protein [Candidatus Roizmanbacteria bacterium]|nr:UDP-glucose/GDP-mannose dehydrogenase family protein [Candidatus Roizmanbacteria bacterium]